MTSSPLSEAAVTSNSPSPWAQSGWLSTEIKPLSPMLWSTPNHTNNDSRMHNTTATSDADELISNLILPPPSPLHSPLPRQSSSYGHNNNNNDIHHHHTVSPLQDYSERSAMESSHPPSISQPFLTLPPAQASKCSFPPSCPVLAFNKGTCTVEIGVVRSVLLDLTSQSSSSHYDIECFNGAKSAAAANGGKLLRVAEKDLQFAPHCPVWFQSLHDNASQVTAVVLASYHAPHMVDTSECFYSVLVDSSHPMVHHGVRLAQLSYRTPFAATTPFSSKPFNTTNNNHTITSVLKDQHVHNNNNNSGGGGRSIPSEVVTSTTLSDVSSTGSLSEPVTPRSTVEVATPPGFDQENIRKFSSKIHLPTWIADMNDLENDLLEPEAKFLRRIEEKTNCILEVDQASSNEGEDGNQPGHHILTIYCDEEPRLAGARTYLENFIIDRVHERLEGRLLYHFAVDQEGDAFHYGWKIVRQRGAEDRKSEVWMTSIPLPSEDCIRAVIGKGGRFINFLRSITGCAVTLESRLEITNEPFVYICANDREKVEEAAVLVDEKIQGKFNS